MILAVLQTISHGGHCQTSPSVHLLRLPLSPWLQLQFDCSIRGPEKRWLFLKNLKTELAHFTRYRGANEPLFCSGRGGALTVNGVYRVFQTAGEYLERDDIGTHTLRKTFGYHYYQKTRDIAGLMMIFNHSSEQVTKRYIGIERDNLERQLWDFKLGV